MKLKKCQQKKLQKLRQKNKSKEIEQLKDELKSKLGKDNTSNIAAVLKLLKELLK